MALFPSAPEGGDGPSSPGGLAPALFLSQAFHEPPNVAHDARSASATAPLKILVFQAVEKGQPLAGPVK